MREERERELVPKQFIITILLFLLLLKCQTFVSGYIENAGKSFNYVLYFHPNSGASSCSIKLCNDLFVIKKSILIVYCSNNSSRLAQLFSFSSSSLSVFQQLFEFVLSFLSLSMMKTFH